MRKAMDRGSLGALRTGRLPISWVLLCAGGNALAGTAPETTPVPPGYTLHRTGNVDDFAYFAGGWITKQHKLKARRVGSKVWEDFPGTLCMTPYLGGMATVDELSLPTKGISGLTLRTFSAQTHQWSVYWVSSKVGELQPPVVGGFNGPHGEFYSEDTDNGRPIKVRFVWDKLDHDHARWQQAFSYDNRTWETNWTADFLRADAAKVCAAGRPRAETTEAN